MLHSHRYTNRRLGEFLKELDLTEGRATGIPTIQQKLQENGSPRATIETDEERTYFLIDIPCNPDCIGVPDMKGDKKELSDIQRFIIVLILANDKITIPKLARSETTLPFGWVKTQLRFVNDLEFEDIYQFLNGRILLRHRLKSSL